MRPENHHGARERGVCMQYSEMLKDPAVRRNFLCVGLILVGMTLPFAILYQLAGNSGYLLISNGISALEESELWRRDPMNSDSLEAGTDKRKLRRVLSEAAMVDNTVILAPVNEAWAAPGSLLDVFLESFRKGDRTERLLKHLVIVALDEKAYEWCKPMHPHCYALKTEGVDFSAEKLFMSEDYLKMTWRKIDFLRVVLELGYDFIFTDADVIWFRDPAPFLYPNGDIQVSCDGYNGNPDDRGNYVNTGFHYVKSNNRTIEFYKYWHTSREKYPGRHDQHVFDIIKGDAHTHGLSLDMKFLPTASFGGLCQLNGDMDKVCTMHTNCCIGLKAKMNDLKVMMDDWKLYWDQPPSFKGRQKPTWRVPQICSIHMP